jgi:hypothetical protein
MNQAARTPGGFYIPWLDTNDNVCQIGEFNSLFDQRFDITAKSGYNYPNISILFL